MSRSTARCLAAFSIALVSLTVLACSGRVAPAPQPPPQPQPQAQENPQPQPQQKPKPAPLEPVALSLTEAVDVFDMGKQGEDKYKGKVVAITGKVNVDVTKPAPAGGSSTVTILGGEGEPPYAIATIGEDSNELLFSSKQWRPFADVAFRGVYRGRDERGTILLDPAQVTSLTGWHQSNRPRRKDFPTVTHKKPDKKPGPPVVVSAERLAQELTDDVVANYPKYFGKTLEIQGVIHKRTEDKGAIVRIDFQPAVTDKNGKPGDFTVFCGLKTPVALKDEAAAGLAVGKKVTIRGGLVAAGNGQATLTGCEIVRD